MKFSEITKFEKLFKDYTELRVQTNSATKISLLNGEVISNVFGEQTGVSSRTFVDGVWGFASSPELTKQGIENVISESEKNATFLASKEGLSKKANAKKVILPCGNINAEHYIPLPQKSRSQKELIDFARELDSYCNTKYPKLASRSVSISQLNMEKTLVSSGSKGFSYSLTPRAIVVVSFTVNEKDEPIDLYDLYGGLGYFDCLFDKPQRLFDKIDILATKLEQKAKGVYPKPGIKDVVLDSDLAGILSHEAIGHTVEADSVLGGSVAADLMDKIVASPLITLIDYANTAFGKTCPVPVWIDDEGTEAKDAVIIKDGYLKSYMHNKESAVHFGVNSTGNARAYGFYDEPLIRMRNTAIVPGTSKLEDMISGIDDGYYFVRPSNGQADSTSEFMFGTVLGYEIKNGKIANALRDTTISGIAFDVLKSVDAVGDKISWTCGGMCGKKQMIPVGMGGPAIKCRINVGGR